MNPLSEFTLTKTTSWLANLHTVINATEYDSKPSALAVELACKK